MSWLDDDKEKGSDKSPGGACSNCGYNQGEVGETCELCGSGTILSPEDFQDKFGVPA